MNWQDNGYLISINKYSENSSIVEFYTKSYGKKSGIIYGSTSKKIRNYLLIGNKFYLNYNSKSENHLGYFKVEIEKITTPLYLENKQKLFCIIYSMNLIKILTAENQKNNELYKLVDSYFNIFDTTHWLVDFILWELKFFKSIGYDINFIDYATKSEINGSYEFIANHNKKKIPNFLIMKSRDFKNNDEILNGFKIVGDYLDKTILKPNNISFPLSRNEFFNTLS